MRRFDLAAVGDQRDPQPQTLIDQPLIYGRDDEGHGQCRVRVVDTPVGEDRDAAAPFGERHDLLAEMVDGRHDRRACIGTGVRAGRVERGERADRGFGLRSEQRQLPGGEYRRTQDDLAGADERIVAAVAAGHLGTYPEGHAQGHPVGLPDAVQRRVGDLGESLGEIAGDAGFDVAQGVDGIAEAHRRDEFGALVQHRIHEVAEALLVQVVRAIALMVGQRGGFCVDVCGSGPIRFRTGLELDGFERREVVEVDLGGGQQRRVVGRGSELLVGVVGGVSAMFTMVVEDHPARGYPAAGDHRVRVHVDLACLGERAQELVGLERPQGTQTQAVEAGTDDRPVAEDDGGGAVVLLLVQREVLEHGAHPGGERGVVLPGRGHHRHDGGDQVEAVLGDPGGDGLVQARAVGLPGRPDDASALCGGGGHLGDAVLLVGVELTVVGQEPERLRHRRVWIGIRGEPGVEEERVHRVIGVGQVGEVADHLGRGEPPLEYLGASRQRQRIQTGQGRFGVTDRLDVQQGLLHEQVEVGGTRSGFGCAEHPLPDRQLRSDGCGAQHRIVHRHIANGEDGESPLCHCRFDQTLGPCLLTRGEEEVADAEPAQGQVRDTGDLAEERLRQVHRHAAAVADALGGHAAAVRDRAQCLGRLDDDVVALHTVLAGDEPDSAAALLVAGVPQQGLCARFALHTSPVSSRLDA